MSKRIERKTKLAEYILDNYRSVSAFITSLNTWAKMKVYEKTKNVAAYARGAQVPSYKHAKKKWEILCDFIEYVSGERPTQDWINPHKYDTENIAEITGNEFKLEFPEEQQDEEATIGASCPELEEIGRAFDTLVRYFATIITTNNNQN